MFLSMAIKGGEKWDTEPTLGMIVGNRSFPASAKLPYSYFFEGLVRQCLLNYLKTNSAHGSTANKSMRLKQDIIRFGHC